MDKYIVQDGQSIIDVVSQLYGGLDSLSTFLNDNRENIGSVDSSLSSAQEVLYTRNNEIISNRFSRDGTIVNTSDPRTSEGYDFNLDFNTDFSS